MYKMNTKDKKMTSPLLGIGMFFMLIGVVVALIVFFVDPRANIVNPGYVLIAIGVLLFAFRVIKKFLTGPR